MKILHISTFPPTCCGIASYTSNLISGLVNSDNYLCNLCYHSEDTNLYSYQIDNNSIQSYYKIIDIINNSTFDLVSIQHEYGIYGGNNGVFILELLKNIRIPTVTTLHTVRSDNSNDQNSILASICKFSTSIVVLSTISKRFIIDKFKIDEKKIRVITHGVSNYNFIDSTNLFKFRDHDKQLIFLTAGHLRSSKGYEIALSTIKLLNERKVDCKLLILGTYQPQFEGGVYYYEYIKNLVSELNLNERVIWINNFLKQTDYYDHIQQCDAAIVSYTEPSQNSSGLIPDILALGRPVFCTMFEYASFIKSITNNCVFVSSFSPYDLCHNIIDVLQTFTITNLQLNAYESTRKFTWELIGKDYENHFKESTVLFHS